MKSSFKKSVAGKYINVEYIADTANFPSELKGNINQWCLNDAEADKFIAKVIEFEPLIEAELKTRNLKYTVPQIILTYIKVIESISSGFDIRRNVPSSELVESFVTSYDKKYNEALKFCTETKLYALEHAKTETYTKDWRRYDKSNDYVKLYMLDTKLLVSDEDFSVSLKSLAEDSAKLLELLIKHNAGV